MSTATKQTFSSTKDLNRTLGKKELMGIAIGQIIGAGVMSMMGVAIAMTGRQTWRSCCLLYLPCVPSSHPSSSPPASV